MRRRVVVLGILGATLLASAVGAHEEFRVAGIISAYQPPLLQVERPDHTQTVVRLDGQTKVTQDATDVPAATLKPGLGVIVDAWGDDESDLLALAIRIVPPQEAR